MPGARSQVHANPLFSVVDLHVAHQVRSRRLTLGLTQQQLADQIAVTCPQLHKYERGINRISAGQLHAIALALGSDLAFFFKHLEPERVEPDQQDQQRRLVELMHNVQLISSPEHRQAVCALAKALASLADQQPAEPA